MASGEYHCTIFPADASQAISTDEVLLSTHKHISSLRLSDAGAIVPYARACQ